MRIIKPSNVVFASDNLERQFYGLRDDDEIKKHIKRAIEDIQKNAFCGTQIPKKLIPGEYVRKYGVRNLWKYDFPDGWRLIYTITTPNKVEIISVLLEWFDHKEYERGFKY